MKQVFILFIALFISMSVLAQSDFREGYIVNYNNDTIYGLIDYRGNKANAKKCIFKMEFNAEKQSFTPDDIKAYRFKESKYYVVKEIKTENDSTQKLFMEYLLNGRVDLYYYRDGNEEHYLIEEEDGILRELRNDEIDIKIDNVIYRKETKGFVPILEEVFKDSREISGRVETLKLNHSSLIDITRDYHTEVCPGEECIIYEKKMLSRIIRFGPYLGFHNTSLFDQNTVDEVFYYLIDADFNSGIYPVFGFSFKMNLIHIHERMFVQYDVNYGRFDAEVNKVTSFPSSTKIFYDDMLLELGVLSNSVALRYEYPKGVIRPTFSLGCFFNYYAKRKFTKHTRTEYTYGAPGHSYTNYWYLFDKTDYGLNASAGTLISVFGESDISIELRYMRGFGFYDKFQTNILQLNVGLQFGN